jgi:hypothetical protein
MLTAARISNVTPALRDKSISSLNIADWSTGRCGWLSLSGFRLNSQFKKWNTEISFERCNCCHYSFGGRKKEEKERKTKKKKCGFVYHRCRFCQWVKRQQRIQLFYRYLL